MDWYWYVLIAVGLILLGVLKLVVWNNMKKRKAAKAAQVKKPEED